MSHEFCCRPFGDRSGDGTGCSGRYRADSLIVTTLRTSSRWSRGIGVYSMELSSATAQLDNLSVTSTSPDHFLVSLLFEFTSLRARIHGGSVCRFCAIISGLFSKRIGYNSHMLKSLFSIRTKPPECVRSQDGALIGPSIQISAFPSSSIKTV
jgi:hypothetical protein